MQFDRLDQRWRQRQVGAGEGQIPPLLQDPAHASKARKKGYKSDISLLSSERLGVLGDKKITSSSLCDSGQIVSKGGGP